MVLDDAREELVNIYHFTAEELSIGSPGHPLHQQRLGALIDLVRSKLSVQHSSLLSREAINIIFNSAAGTIRGDGNNAAHEAPIADRAVAVMDAALKETQRVALRGIYQFAYGKEPDFEGPAL